MSVSLMYTVRSENGCGHQSPMCLGYPPIVEEEVGRQGDCPFRLPFVREDLWRVKDDCQEGAGSSTNCSLLHQTSRRECQSGEDENGLLLECGSTWRKVNVQQILDESTMNLVKMRYQSCWTLSI